MKAFRCAECGALLSNDSVALNLRLRGNGIGSFYCDDCFSQMLDTSSEELEELKAYFKAIGCALFERSYI